MKHRSLLLVVGVLAVVMVGLSRRAAIVHAEPAILKTVADVPLSGSATRFDYQSLDPTTGRLYLSHMGAGRLVVFDTKTEKVVADLPGFPTVTGVLAVPELHRVYASAAGNHEVVVVDTRTLKVVARVPGPDFPDGIAYDPAEQKVFVSDESGGADYVIDARTDKLLTIIRLGGEAGNTQFDPVSDRIFVAVQTRNQLAAIDPKTDRIAARYDLPGSDHPHGFYIDAPRRLMFVSCEGNSKLLVVEMHSMRITQTLTVGEGPDVLKFDPGWRRLYVASESGVVSVFDETDKGLVKRGETAAPNAHSVEVDPRTHRIYLPLKNLNGHPALRIMEPTEATAHP